MNYVRLTERSILRVGGADARTLLQGLVTQNVDNIRSDRAVFSALLSAQGKFQFDFFIAEHEDSLLFEIETQRKDALKRMLSIYKLRSDVTIDELPEAQVAVIPTLQAATQFELDTQVGAAAALPVPCGWVLAYVDPRLAELGVRIIADSQASLEQLITDRSLMQADFKAYDKARLELGVPDGSRDAEIDRTILLENGYDVLNGIDFHKGCYVGQEVTARSKHRGQLRKKLCRVRADAELPPKGTEITAGNRKLGQMRSSCDDIGMALLRLDFLSAAQEANEPVLAGECELQVERPFWHEQDETEQAS
jgi:folate-binding protein YgfZ